MRLWMFLQVKKELVAVHAINMVNKQGSQRTYGVLTDGIYLVILCFDAGKNYKEWRSKDITMLPGTFMHTKCALCMLCRQLRWWPSLDVLPIAVL